jgi:hypothetical protein
MYGFGGGPGDPPVKEKSEPMHVPMALHIYHVLVTALKEILRSCRSCRSLKLALTNVAVCRGREWLVDANY